MRTIQPLWLIFKRLARRNYGYECVYAALEKKSKDDERARCSLSIDTINDVEGEDDDKIHEGEADEAEQEWETPWSHALEFITIRRLIWKEYGDYC